jgi:hypothetical protein
MKLLIDGHRIDACWPCVLEWADSRAGSINNPDWHDEEVPDTLHWTGADRYCAGAYAGRYCDKHWREAGYRTDLPNVVGGMSEDEIEAYDYRHEVDQ